MFEGGTSHPALGDPVRHPVALHLPLWWRLHRPCPRHRHLCFLRSFYSKKNYTLQRCSRNIARQISKLSEDSYPVRHLLANLLLHILTLGCACATSGHSLLAGNQAVSTEDVSFAIRVWIVFWIHPYTYVSTTNVMASPVDRLHTCPSQPHKCLRCPSRCRNQPPLDFMNLTSQSQDSPCGMTTPGFWQVGVPQPTPG